MARINLTSKDFGLDKFNGRKLRIEGAIDAPTFRVSATDIDIKPAIEQIKEIHRKTLELSASRLEVLLDSAMASGIWGELGDIIDSGDLRDSLSVIIEGDDIGVSYDSPYANLIHYGGYIAPYGNTNIDKVYIPGRPWVESVFFGNGPVESINVPEIFEEAIRS
jgi:hypothetical protein